MTSSFTLETWQSQEARLPQSGEHIIAHRTPSGSFVVYQAFNSQIAEFVREAGRFSGAPGYNASRMTWIKPGFLWMMYRSGWGEKDPNQERILAISLRPAFFWEIVGGAETKGSGDVRLQFDPDHLPGSTLPHPGGRRVIQLGLRGAMATRLAQADPRDVEAIEDITDMVKEQKRNFDQDPSTLAYPAEHVQEDEWKDERRKR